MWVRDVREKALSPFSVKFNHIHLVWLNLMYFTSTLMIMLFIRSRMRRCVISVISHILAWQILAWNRNSGKIGNSFFLFAFTT